MSALEVTSENRTVPLRKNLFEEDKSGQVALLGSRCNKCASVFFPQKTYCDYCQAGDLVPVRFGRRGRIHTFTIVRQASPEFKVPYAIGRVDADEGVRVFSQILADDLEKIEIGQPVELVVDRLFNESDGTEVTGYKYQVVGR
jgi:uncharacterized OB-fold protein